MKKWNYRYRVAALKNTCSEICDFVKSLSDIEKGSVHEEAQLIGVIFSVKPTTMTELCERKLFVKNENKNNKKNSRFCHFLVWYFAGVSDDQ